MNFRSRIHTRLVFPAQRGVVMESRFDSAVVSDIKNLTPGSSTSSDFYILD